MARITNEVQPRLALESGVPAAQDAPSLVSANPSRTTSRLEGSLDQCTLHYGNPVGGEVALMQREG